MATPLKIEIRREGKLLDERSFDQSIIKIGRLSSAHLRLDDDKVSRIHAVMEAASGGLSITDMGSAEGTNINGNRITKTEVSEGDEITLGGTTLTVRFGTAAAETSAETDPAAAASTAAAEQPVGEGGQGGGAGLASDRESEDQGVSVPGAGHTPEQGPVGTAAGGEGASVPQGAFQVPEEAARFDTRGFIEGKVDPAPVPDADNRAIELRLMWGEVLLDVAHIKHRKTVTIGESRKSHFFLTSEDFPIPEFPLLSHDGDYQLSITPKMEGVARVGERTCTLAETVKERIASPHPTLEGTYMIRLSPEVRAAIQFGGVTVLVRSVTPTRPVVAPFGGQINYSFLNSFLLSLFAHLALLITAVNYPYDTRLIEDQIFTTPNRFAKMILTPPEEPERNPLLDRLKEEDAAAEAEKHKEDEGKAGIKELLEQDAKSAPKAVDPTDQELVSQVFERLEGGDRGLATVFDQSGLGGDMDGALGGLIGSVVGDAGGAEGLGLKGLGGGGGGLSGSTIGTGGIGTRGRASGDGGYGKGVHGLGDREDTDIDISEGEPQIRGALDRELIRRVIHRNRSQIRYCYELELQRAPDLHGRVALRFTIAANGSVAQASVRENTTGNAQLAQCLVTRLKNWQFPEPKGGGIVIVTYPFVFQQAGQ